MVDCFVKKDKESKKTYAAFLDSLINNDLIYRALNIFNNQIDDNNGEYQADDNSIFPHVHQFVE